MNPRAVNLERAGPPRYPRSVPAVLLVLAQAAPAAPAESGLGTVAVLVLLAIVPFLLVTLTSFLKLAVVLALVKNAIGAPGVPPGTVTTGLAVVLSLVIMAPVAGEMFTAARPALAAAADHPLSSAETAGVAIDAAQRAREPLRAFLVRHAHPGDRALFADLARRLRRPEDRAAVADSDLAVLAPAFVTSQLKEAFAIGFLLLLPFLIIDFVVAATLASLGLQGLTTAQVSLPFKLLLFVLADGWLLLARGLVLGYA